MNDDHEMPFGLHLFLFAVMVFVVIVLITGIVRGSEASGELATCPCPPAETAAVRVERLSRELRLAKAELLVNRKI